MLSVNNSYLLNLFLLLQNGFWCAFAIGVFFWAQAVVIGEILYIFFIKIDSDDRVLYVE